MNIRQEFPLLKSSPLIYLDSAATTHKPQAVIDAMMQFYTQGYGTVHRALYKLAAEATAQYHAVRQQVQQFLNAESSDEIIFTKGTTEAINLVAASFGEAFVRAGDEILISEMEHHSNIVPWQLLCARAGAHLRVAPIDESGQLIKEEFEKLLNERTRLVSVAHISNATGTQNPIEWIIEKAHEFGAKVFIDGAQSAGHIPVDVQLLDADFFAFSGHKIFGPTGVGILYGKREILEQMPPYQGGGDMIERVTFEKTTYQAPPLRFEAGTPMIAEVMGLGAALTFIENLGRARVASWEQELLQHATERLLQIPGLRLIGTAPQKGAIVTFVVQDVHSSDIGSMLDAKGVAVRTGHLCAQPTMRRFGVETATRLSFAPYNTCEEIDQCVDALSKILPVLRP